MITLNSIHSPDFLIIGAQKCGTTSLFYYLLQHPELFLPIEKEIHFFDLKYHHGIDWYRNIFNTGEEGNGKLKGEASPYYIFHPLVAERVFSHIPSVKLILLLRDPVDRAYSHFMHSRRFALEPLDSFEKAIESEPARTWDEKSRILSGEIENSEAFRNFSYISRSLYFQQISYWLKYFPPEQIHCIKSEELFANPGPVYSALCQFLGISDFKNVKFEPLNAFSYPDLSPEFRKKIRIHFHEDMCSLARLLGDNFYWE
ncbi:MAG: sulfotransferase domain-containing protein [Bacteroidales bacterium]